MGSRTVGAPVLLFVVAVMLWGGAAADGVLDVWAWVGFGAAILALVWLMGVAIYVNRRRGRG